MTFGLAKDGKAVIKPYEFASANEFAGTDAVSFSQGRHCNGNKPFTNMACRAPFMCLLLLFPFLAKAQNLVRNAGFENHANAVYNSDAEFAMVMPGWRSMKAPRLHDCNNGKPGGDWVDLSMYKAKEGCAMVELGFSPNCGKLGDGNFPYIGCANYLVSPLSETLEIGQLYRVSFWVYFTNVFVRQNPDARRHVGMLLSNKPLPPDPLLEMLENTTFLAPELPYNTWQQATWYVRPTCELNYLTIGVFKDAGWPVYTVPEFDRSIYFIDQVSVTQVKESEVAATDVPVQYCKNSPQESKTAYAEIPDATCHFATNDWQLDAAARQALDDFATSAKAHPELVFLVSGHTDAQGNNHTELSQKRVNAARNYLLQQYAIPAFRLISLLGGKAYPAASNESETGRRQNRRVVLQRLDLSVASALYRQTLAYAAENKTDSAFLLLQGWFHQARDREKILTLFDPRLEKIRTHPRWKTLFPRIRAAYNRYPKSDLAFLLDSLYCEDQQYRTLEPFVLDLGGYVKAVDTVAQLFPPVSSEVWQQKDAAIARRLLRVLDKEGLPAESEVGARAAKAAAVILIHTSDTTVLQKYLPLLEARCREGEGDWNYYATLFDRLRTCRQLPQRYGTQFVASKQTPNAIAMYPLEDRARLNAWRQEIGLPPLSDAEIDRVIPQ